MVLNTTKQHNSFNYILKMETHVESLVTIDMVSVPTLYTENILRLFCGVDISVSSFHFHKWIYIFNFSLC